MSGLLIKPFTATVGSDGYASVTVEHNLHGLVWKVYQIGCALGIVNVNAQAAAHVNGIPLAPTIPMQPTAFSQIVGAAPYAMESTFNGPPYIPLSAGDQIVVAVVNATATDTFTVGAYVTEFQATDPVAFNMGI